MYECFPYSCILNDTKTFPKSLITSTVTWAKVIILSLVKYKFWLGNLCHVCID